MTLHLVLGALLALPAIDRSGVTASAAADSDPRAVALAESVLDAMGGRESWEHTRFLRWRFFGKRLHHWDRWTGDVRIEFDSRLVLMNVHTKQGRAWEDGAEITDADGLAQAMQDGYALWVNDSYWLIMPYKLLDPGCRLRHGGKSELPDGRPAERITLSFDEETGLTPENRYDLWIASDTGLVEQWAFYATSGDAEPAFTLPWAGWKRFGGILLATNHGRDADWEIAAPDSLPRSVFESP